jgi:hypothetical protein
VNPKNYYIRKKKKTFHILMWEEEKVKIKVHKSFCILPLLRRRFICNIYLFHFISSKISLTYIFIHIMVKLNLKIFIYLRFYKCRAQWHYTHCSAYININLQILSQIKLIPVTRNNLHISYILHPTYPHSIIQHA